MWRFLGFNIFVETALYMLVLFPALELIFSSFSPILTEHTAYGKPIMEVRNQKEYDRVLRENKSYPILSFVGLANLYNYTAEEFNVTTRDGYVLKLHRISGSPQSPVKDNKPIVYLQHGFALSSHSWICTGSSIAFMLADRGMDVYLGNVRGNAYSNYSRSNKQTDKKIHDYGFHEMATVDLRGLIDFVLNKTGQNRLTYIGFSMGTTLSYVLLSMHPEYNEKIIHLYSLAPIALYSNELPAIPAFIYKNFVFFDSLISRYGLHQMLPQTSLGIYLGRTFCKDNMPLTQPSCLYLLSFLGGDTNKINKTKLPDILTYVPAGVTSTAFYNYYQNYEKRTFQAYDYGENDNLIHYNDTIPPAYDLSKITVPHSMWCAQNDDVVNHQDVIDLFNYLPPGNTTLHRIEDDKFNHFDFLFASNVKELLYNRIVNETVNRV